MFEAELEQKLIELAQNNKDYDKNEAMDYSFE